MSNQAILTQSTKNFWETLSDGVIFSATGSFLGSQVANWAQVSISPSGFIAGGLYNAAAIGIGNSLAGTAGLSIGEVNWKKALVVTAALGATTIAAPFLTQASSSFTGIVLNFEAAKTLALFHGALKVFTYAIAHPILYYKYHHDSLETPKANMTNAELYEAKFPPQENASNGNLPDQVETDILALKAGEVDELSETKLKWFYRYFEITKKAVSDDVREALSARFMGLKWPPPNDHFVYAKFVRPENLLKIHDSEKYLIGWCRNHFIKNPQEFTDSTIDDRLEWRSICRDHLKLHIPIPLKLDEVQESSDKDIKDYHSYFESASNRSEWNCLDMEVQKSLNNRFDNLKLSSFQLFPRSVEDLSTLDKKAFISFLKNNPNFETDLTDEVRAAMKSSYAWKYAIGLILTTLVAGAYFNGRIPLPASPSVPTKPMQPVSTVAATESQTPVLPPSSPIPPYTESHFSNKSAVELKSE